MAKKQLIEDIKAEPARFFRSPGDVLRDRRFADNERLEILAAWELVAGAANDNDPAVLSAVQSARSEIERRLSASEKYGN